MKKKSIRSIAVISFLASALVIYVHNNIDSFLEIEIVNQQVLLAALILIPLNFYVYGKMIDIVLSNYGVRLSNTESLGLSVLTRLGNYVSIGYMGAAIRAYYIKRNHGLSYTRFASGFILSNILQLLYTGLIIITTYFILSNKVGLIAYYVFFALVAMSLLILVPLHGLTGKIAEINKSRNYKKLHQLITVIDEFSTYRRNKKLLISMAFWQSIGIFCSSSLLFIVYTSIGLNISYLSTIFISIFAGWALIFSLTPANIGVSESFSVVGATLVGVPIPETITVTIVLRMINFIGVLIFSAYFAPLLLEKSVGNVMRGKFK